jgi:mRNA-degrading endonuclease YafQ of YafQ-DinJ toxin-antitoxin module
MQTWQLIFTDSYNRRAARFLKRHPELQPSYRKLLLLLEANPFHPSLRLHTRQGKLKGLDSVSSNRSTSSGTKLRNWGLSLNCL